MCPAAPDGSRCAARSVHVETDARLTSPAQLVAALPHWLGFQATESLVVLCLHEPRGRLGLTMRYDLPPVVQEAQLLGEVLARVRHEDATRVALVVLTDDPSPGARADLVDALLTGLAPLSVTEAVLVRGAASGPTSARRSSAALRQAHRSSPVRRPARCGCSRPRRRWPVAPCCPAGRSSKGCSRHRPSWPARVRRSGSSVPGPSSVGPWTTRGSSGSGTGA